MINLMFCGNYKVIDGMIISLLSIVKYCKKPLNIFVLTMDLQEMNENLNKFISEYCNKNCIVVLYIRINRLRG